MRHVLDAHALAFVFVLDETVHQEASIFRIETTLNFTGCGEILPVDVVR